MLGELLLRNKASKGYHSLYYMIIIEYVHQFSSHSIRHYYLLTLLPFLQMRGATERKHFISYSNDSKKNKRLNLFQPESYLMFASFVKIREIRQKIGQSSNPA